MRYQESISSRNITDVDITKLEDSHKGETAQILEDHFIYSGRGSTKLGFGGPLVSEGYLENKPVTKKTRGQNSSEYGKNLKVVEGDRMPRMTMGDFKEKQTQVPYYWYVDKRERIGQLKRMVNSTQSLYGFLKETETFSKTNNSVLMKRLSDV